MKLDCTLLVLASIGVYVYGMFSIFGSVFAVQDGLPGKILINLFEVDFYLNKFLGASEALFAELFSLIQVSVQTLFVLNACWRRCKGANQIRNK